MSKTLKDYWDGSFFGQCWLWCDIDGHGKSWRLAIKIDDYAAHYMDYPAREIVKPLEPEDAP